MKMFSWIISLFIILGAFCFSQFMPRSNAATFTDVVVEAEKGGYQLIEMDELWKLYQQKEKELLLVDTREDWEYHGGYIKGAINFPMVPTWLARMTQRGALEQVLGQDKKKILVFY